MMRHLMNESTSTFFFSEVMKRSGSLCVQRQDAGIEEAHVLHQRQLEIQPGLLLHRDDFTQLEHQRILALIDR